MNDAVCLERVDRCLHVLDRHLGQDDEPGLPPGDPTRGLGPANSFLHVGQIPKAEPVAATVRLDIEVQEPFDGR